ncbi:Fe(3+) ABC transporter substrate-binding protein [Halobacteriovorax marinus]|uniref:Fe(3+) ABC transporter substrate-binding protein n=1 Tax=Halobacteriovorax marinus TaxID=97084 RepID=A0A1Y5FHW8_9BACT|nr:Fe(3+) ABC transporter substrate-binding protein [Halobacteriovorax marinus]
MKFLIPFLVLFSSVASAKTLTIYTSRKEHLIKPILDLYTKETGVKFNYTTNKDGALIQRLKAEGSSTPADLLFTVDGGNLWYASTQNILEPINSQILDKNIPASFKDPKNLWFAFSLRARTIVYNPKTVKKGELSTYEDLATSKWKGRLCLRTSKKVYNQSLVAELIDTLGRKKAKKVVAGWVANTVDIFSNDTSAIKGVISGQCDAAIVNTYYYGRLLKKDPSIGVKIFWPNQNDKLGVHINVSGAGLLKYSKNKKESKKFLEWLSGGKAQALFASLNLEYPANPSVDLDPLVKSWGTFKYNKEFNLSKAGMLQKDAIKLMHEVQYK